MSESTAIFWPMIAHAVLIFAVYPVLFNRRKAAVKERAARVEDFRVPVREPEKSASAARNLSHQYELPVLFYVVCLALFVTGGAGWLAVSLAWLFALSRLAHAYIHLGSNQLNQRIPAFAAGLILVGLLWLTLAVHLVLGG